MTRPGGVGAPSPSQGRAARGRRARAQAVALALAGALCAIALAGCSSPSATRQGATRAPAATSRDETAFRTMFDETVPSIEAALPLALMVESTVVTDTSAFASRAWFSARQPVCMKLLLIERGDTTSADDFYYRDGRLVAWSKFTRAGRNDPDPHSGTTRALFGRDGAARWVELTADGVVVPRRLALPPGVVKWMTAELDTGMRSMLVRKAQRSSRW